MQRKKLNQETLILIFLVLTVLAGFIMFAYKTFGPKKVETAKNVEIQVEETNVNPDDPPIITVDELKSKIDNNEDIVIVDVQSREGYLEKHIPKAISIPIEQISEQYKNLPKDKEIIVTSIGEAIDKCGICTQAARSLISLGFKNVKDLKEGILGWEAKGYPVVAGEEVTFKNIDADKLKKMIDDRKNILIIDIRDKEEYDQEHIQGAVFMPFEGFLQKKDELPRDKEIIIYDKLGYRSKLVTENLVKQGLIQVSNLIDGFKKWKEKGYPVES
jgi:rhodanese-related sulfurtransferase